MKSLEKIIFLVLVTNMVVVICCTYADYPAPEYNGPASPLAFPFADNFKPTVTQSTPPAGTPEIAEWTRDNNAGDTIIMTGERFSADQTILTKVTTVNALLFDDYGDRIEIGGFSWTTGAKISITASAYQTPSNGDWLFHVKENSNEAGIYYSSGKWYAKNGTSSTVIGNYDTASHTFTYDFSAGTARMDNNATALGTMTPISGTLYIGCNVPAYQDFPLSVSEYVISANNVASIDAIPLADGTFVNTVDGSIIENANTGGGIHPPFTVDSAIETRHSGGSQSLFMAYGSGVTNACEIVRIDGDEAAVRLSANLPPNEVYLLWPGNINGYGKPVVVNRAEAWWVGPDRINAGGTFSLYGRNLGTSCWIYIEGNGFKQWRQSDTCNPYKADFTMPSGLGTGSYTVWAHNGSGGQYGWSKPISVSVVAPYAYGGTTINVKTYGAVGNGTTDDYSAIASAVSASRAGDTIYFPAGTYALSNRIGDLTGRKILGDGIDITILKPYTSSAGFVLDGHYSDMLVTKLTIESISSITGNAIVRWRGDRNTFDTIKLSSFPWSAAGWKCSPFIFTNNSYLKFKNCTFVNAGNPGNLDIGACRQVFLDGCHFYGARECSILVSAWGGEETSIQNCTAQPYDGTVDGYFDGRWFATIDDWGSVNRIYFGDNTSLNCAPPKVAGYHANTGEQILFEQGVNIERGQVVSGTSTTLKIPTTANITGSRTVATIVAGRGYGQSRMVSSVNTGSSTLVLDEPWRIVPDSSSTFVISRPPYRIAVYNNHLDGKAEWVNTTDVTASAGVEPYGSAIDLIVDGNTFSDLQHAIAHWPLSGDQSDQYVSLQCCFFNTFINNTFTNCREGIKTEVETNGGMADGGVLAATIRNNRFESILTKAIYYNIIDAQDPVVKMSVIERNVFNNCKSYAVQDDVHVENQLFLDNTGANNNEGTAMSLTYNHIPALKNNQFTGYSVEFQNGPITQREPGELLNLPASLVFVDNALMTGQSRSVPVWNLGSADLTCTASCPSAWVTLANNTDIHVAGQEVGAFSFSIDPQLRPANETIATISVVSGSQTQKVAVVYDGTTTPTSIRSIDYDFSGLYSGKPLKAELRYREGGFVSPVQGEWGNLETNPMISIKFQSVDNREYFLWVYELTTEGWIRKEVSNDGKMEITLRNTP